MAARIVNAGGLTVFVVVSSSPFSSAALQTGKAGWIFLPLLSLALVCSPAPGPAALFNRSAPSRISLLVLGEIRQVGDAVSGGSGWPADASQGTAQSCPPSCCSAWAKIASVTS